MFTLPDLPFSTNALEPHIDTTTMEIHHGKHHAAYVKNLNDVLPEKSDRDLPEILQNLESLPESIRTKVRNNAGGHYNHSLFWQTIGPGNSKPTGKLAELITSVCGDLDTFKHNLTQVALDRFGSGWAWVIPQGRGLFFTSTPNQDNPLMEGKTPILGLDVWEHAYYLKYQNRRTDYISAWWNVVNWTAVSENFARDRA